MDGPSVNSNEMVDRTLLLERARLGSGAALGELLECYRHYLGILARLQIGRRIQGKADEADLVQETFLQAHRCLHQFTGRTEAEFAGWLRQILASRIAKLLRRFLATGARNVDLERELIETLGDSSNRLAGGMVSSQSTPSQRACRKEEALLLADALAQLPRHYQDVIVLRHFEELSFPAIAEQMQRSVDSVEKIWLRALPRLSLILGAP